MRTLEQLIKISNKIGRVGFLDSTKRLTKEIKAMNKLGSEGRRKLSKEVISEVTRKFIE